jgi:hypothetical protein
MVVAPRFTPARPGRPIPGGHGAGTDKLSDLMRSGRLPRQRRFCASVTLLIAADM